MVKNVGDSVDKGEAILELETDKVNVEVVSEEAGVLSEQLANEGDTVEVGQAIAVVGEGSGNASSGSSDNQTPQSNDETNKDDQQSKETSQPSNDNQSSDQSQDDSANNQRVKATPSARRHARANGVDLSEVAGKSNDVVRKEDVNNSQNQAQQSSQNDNKPSGNEAKNLVTNHLNQLFVKNVTQKENCC